MTIALTVVHVIMCFAIIGIVLLQAGKGADIGSAFGGAGSQAVFGSMGTPTILGKITTVVAVTFAITSFSLALLGGERSGSSVVRERPDGTRETLATHWGDKELNSPNDVIVASDGSIIFTDPTYGRMPGFGLEREQELDFQGVYRLPAGGGDLELLVDDFAQPNGLCFSSDESLLYINDTTRAHIRVFDVGPSHSLSNATCSPRTSATVISRRAASSTG